MRTFQFLCFAVTCLALNAAPSAYAKLDVPALDAELVSRYCAGMMQQFAMPDGTKADCISDTHAIEVEKAGFWYDSLGQSLHYALWTSEIAEQPDAFKPQSSKIEKPRKAGIVFVCMRPQQEGELCTEHYARLFRIIEEYRLPVTIWDCNWNEHMRLDDCPVRDMPQPTTGQR
jgi:hypothetical protein